LTVVCLLPYDLRHGRRFDVCFRGFGHGGGAGGRSVPDLRAAAAGGSGLLHPGGGFVVCHPLPGRGVCRCPPELFSAELDDSPVDRTFGSPTILTVDGAPHLELRRSLDSKYRPKHVNAYIEDLVRPIAEQVLDGLAGRGHAELMADYLEPVSVLSLGTVLGVAHLGAARLRDWFWRLHLGVINFEG